jgi:hypothetical protein
VHESENREKIFRGEHGFVPGSMVNGA